MVVGEWVIRPPSCRQCVEKICGSRHFAMNRVVLTTVVAIFGLGLSLVPGSAQPQRPNIVIMLADDMGWNDIGVHGSDVPTPNIDALAYSGTILKRHYAQPCCTPSRSALLTGQYPIRYGLQGYPLSSLYMDGLPTNIPTMPQILKSLGYKTHLVGKWHQGYATNSHMPTNRGFDSFFGYLNGFLSYYDGVMKEAANIGLDFRSNETESWRLAYGKYLPQLLSQQADNVIRNHSKFHKEDPLFLLVATNAPHAGGNRPFSQELPPIRSQTTEFITNPERRMFADVMQYVDQTLGSLTSTLKDEGMLDNTVILFLSDNGGPSIDPKWGFGNSASNFPFRGTKMSVFEGGVRAAAIMWKSGMSSTPKVYENLFHISDWLPTLNSAAGGSKLKNVDGVDHWLALTSNSTNPPRNEVLIEIYDQSNAWGYLVNNYKYVKSFNRSDPLQFADVYFSSPPTLNVKGYQMDDVFNSQVALSVGLTNSTDEFLNVRSQMMITSKCGMDDQAKAKDHNCSKEEGCLFDVVADPSECFDISELYPNITSSLMKKLQLYKDAMVPRRKLPPTGRPNERNYYGPVSSVSCWYSNFFTTALLSLAPLHVQLMHNR